MPGSSYLLCIIIVLGTFNAAWSAPPANQNRLDDVAWANSQRLHFYYSYEEYFPSQESVRDSLTADVYYSSIRELVNGVNSSDSTVFVLVDARHGNFIHFIDRRLHGSPAYPMQLEISRFNFVDKLRNMPTYIGKRLAYPVICENYLGQEVMNTTCLNLVVSVRLNRIDTRTAITEGYMQMKNIPFGELWSAEYPLSAKFTDSSRPFDKRSALGISFDK